LMPGVSVGVKSWIGPNYMVQRDLPAKTIAFLKQNEEKRAMSI